MRLQSILQEERLYLDQAHITCRESYIYFDYRYEGVHVHLISAITIQIDSFFAICGIFRH